MSNTYEDAQVEVGDLLHTIRAAHFGSLHNAKIALLFDTKRRKAGGMIVLAKIASTNDLIRYLTKSEIGLYEGYDYIIVIDRICWDAIDTTDRTRILRHELRHAYFDIDCEEHPYKIVDHDIEDFHREVELNADDPKWRIRLASLTDSIYEQKKEDKAPPTGRRYGRGRKAGKADAPMKGQAELPTKKGE